MQQPEDDQRPVLAVDLGGTKILAALVSARGELISREYRLTLAAEGPEAVVGRILDIAAAMMAKAGLEASQVAAFAMASAGIIDSERGVVAVSPNLPGFVDIPLRDIISEKFGLYTVLLNDASAAALGEHRLGAGRGLDNMVYLTISTGIGGGLIVNGELYLGVSGSAGELGHMIIDINGPKNTCGNYGCLESLASGRAIAGEAIACIMKGQSSVLSQVKDIESITARDVAVAARDGDSLAKEVIRQAAGWLGVGLVNVVNIFNPDAIVIGGGVSKMGDLLLGPAREVVAEKAFKLPALAARIVPAQFGDDAAILGAALFARRQKEEAG